MTNQSSATVDQNDSLWTALFAGTLVLGLPALMVASAILHS